MIVPVFIFNSFSWLKIIELNLEQILYLSVSCLKDKKGRLPLEISLSFIHFNCLYHLIFSYLDMKDVSGNPPVVMATSMQLMLNFF